MVTNQRGFSDMDFITRPIVSVINSTYTLLTGSLGWLDTPGTYIIWIVIGLIYVPFLVRNIYEQYANPHGYYAVTLIRKAIMGVIFIVAWLIFGYANFIRFL
jgi:hypothetical protein